VTLPRRLQLMKLLGSRGLRVSERMREEEVRQALAKLKMKPTAVQEMPSSPSLARRSDSAPAVIDEDDPHALPRFREPRLLLPDHERTFLRAIAQKPRVCFFTWDVARARRRGSARLQVRWAEFLGDPQDSAALLKLAPSLTVDVDVGAGGWYVPVPGERLAIIGRLMDADGVICTSNVTLTPPARPAPPGPLWLATLPPALSRRALRGRALLAGAVPEANLQRVGEIDARLLEDLEDEAHSSIFRLRGGASSSESASSESAARARDSGDER
jgi:hypothetical protein